MAQRKNPELDVLHQSILRKMQQLPENKICADCKGPSPRWASTNLGIFVCISCSGIHRKIGTHISQVRSITLDTWTPAQIAHFQKLGNAKAAMYFEACIPEEFRRPTAGDSMQMEKFIREKYEKKRFITIENGGLGGVADERELRRASLQPKTPSRNPPSLGRRPMQAQPSFDSRRGESRKSMPLSYGDTFRSASPPQTSVSTSSQRRLSDSRGLFNLSQIGLSKPGNAIQRASTVREIMNMGFPAEVAARAAEAAEGDLQRAVDWVLANNPAAHEPPPPKPKAQPIRDLLDFGDPVPTPTPITNAAPGALSSESLLKSSASAKPTAAVQNDFADFADFGAFESALPTVSGKAPVPSPPSQVGSASFAGSISGLYAQGAGRTKGMVQQPLGVGGLGRMQGSPQKSSMPASTGFAQMGRVGGIPLQTGQQNTNQAGHSYRSPRSIPLSSGGYSHLDGMGNVQLQPGSIMGWRSVTKQISPRGGPLSSQGYQHPNHGGVAQFKASQPGSGTTALGSPKPLGALGFAQLPGAGNVRPGNFTQSKKATVSSSPVKTGSPNAIPTFTWQTEINPTNDPKSTIPMTNINNTAIANGSHASATPPLPPPPPPPQEASVASSEHAPPPPDGPPPTGIDAPAPTTSQATTSEIEIIKSDTGPEMAEKDGGGDGEVVDEKEEEEEDPFAALSMLALSSATSKKKSKFKEPTVKAPVTPEDPISNGSVAPSKSNSLGIDLDNLLG